MVCILFVNAMKNLGWQMFFALLLADVVAVIMLKLAVAVKVVITVALVVFVIIAAVMALGHNSREKIRKREAEAAAKIADLRDKMNEAKKTDD